MTTFREMFEQREHKIQQETRERLENYEIKVLHRDGVYRHLYCYWPDDPYGGFNYSFHVHTSPGIITILGDWCKAWTLKRETDMLRDFLNTAPNPRYWAEKIQNPNARESVWESDYDCTKQWVHEYLAERYEGETLAKVLSEVDWSIPYDEPAIRVYDALEQFTFWDECEEYAPFEDVEDYPWEVYTSEWLRVCEMLSWVAGKTVEYEKNSNYGRTKH